MEAARIAIEVAIAVFGVVLTIYFTRRLERQKQATERARAAYEACLELRKTLADWINEIADATRSERSAQGVISRLQAVFELQHFERQVSDRFHDLENEPLCRGLFGKTNAFTRQAFESKGKIAMALVPGHFQRDYCAHRDEALAALRKVYDDFQTELERVIPLLQRNARL